MPASQTFFTKIMTRAGQLFADEVISAVIPGQDGYLGLKANHAPMVTALGIGEAVVTVPDGHKHYFAVTGGIAEVGDNQLVLLADIGERAEDIDVDRAESAVQRARSRLRGEANEESVDITRAEVALTRALNRLRVARHGR